jgi:hypothetical protein
MTQLRKILWLTFTAAALLLLAGRVSADTYVTPTVAPTPLGQRRLPARAATRRVLAVLVGLMMAPFTRPAVAQSSFDISLAPPRPRPWRVSQA